MQLKDWNVNLEEWFKKEPKEPIPTPTLETSAQMLLRARVAQLDPNCKYLFMWEQSLNRAHIQMIRRNLFALLGEKNVTLWTGVRIPEIYEFKKDEEEKASA